MLLLIFPVLLFAGYVYDVFLCIKRNTDAVTQWFSLNISETNKASNFKKVNSVALDTLYIFTGNDVTSYFRSAVNRRNAFIWGSRSGRDFSMTVQPIQKKFTVFGIVVYPLRKWLSQYVNILLPLVYRVLAAIAPTLEACTESCEAQCCRCVNECIYECNGLWIHRPIMRIQEKAPLLESLF